MKIIQKKKIDIETEKISGTINLKGLIFDNIVLNEYKEEINSNNKVQLLLNKNSEKPYFVEFSWNTDGEIDLPNKNTIWNSTDNKLTINNPITLTWSNKQKITFKVVISIDENYMFNIQQTVINNSNNAISLNILNKINKTNPLNKEKTVSVHEGFVGVFNKRLEEIKYNRIKTEKTFDNGFNWGGLTDKYWLVSLSSLDKSSNLYNVTINKENNYYTLKIIGNKFIVNPKSETIINSLLFTGPKILSILDNYSKQYDLHLFDRALDFGWFYFISKPIYILLKLFNNFFKNFGFSIIFLTFFIKCLIMYPITKKSFVSIANIKKIQPKVDQIKKTYSSDKITMNKKLVELYQKEKVNPMSGCLPMLLQIPIFFSLYKVLVISIDMRQAPFFGFIKDLSMKDPTTIWNLFGLLPFKPTFLPIGILPILMSLTMWLQQKMSGQVNSNPDTASATKMMPFIFLLVFSSMPSGLLIYWTFSNIITITQQYYIEKKLNGNKQKFI